MFCAIKRIIDIPVVIANGTGLEFSNFIGCFLEDNFTLTISRYIADDKLFIDSQLCFLGYWQLSKCPVMKISQI
jgi:hypothetical protein